MARPRTRHRGGPKLIDAPERMAVTPTQVQIGYALQPLDQVAREMDRKWGYDRLIENVSPETAARFGHVMRKLDLAIEEQRLQGEDSVIACCANLIKGWRIMDAEAESLGCTPPSHDFIEFVADGNRIAIVKDEAAVPQITALLEQPVLVFTPEEAGRLMANALDKLREKTGLVEEMFPGAKVKEFRRTRPPIEEDVIPF